MYRIKAPSDTIRILFQAKQWPPQCVAAFHIIKSQKANKRQEIAQILTNTIADWSSTSILLRKHGQSPAIDSNILRRHEKVKCQEKGCQSTHIKSAGSSTDTAQSQLLFHKVGSTNHAQAGNQLNRNEPCFAAPKSLEKQGIDNGSP